MERAIPEPDWKLFSRELQPLALDRFCQRVLKELVRVAGDESRTHHERYGAVYRLIKDRDRELAHAFDDPRRSSALVQLAVIRRQGLLTDQEMSRFTPETQAWVEKMLSL